MTDPVRYATPVTIAPVLRYAILFLIAGLVLIPLLTTVLGGFKSLGDLRVNPFGLPAQWELDNYWSILSGTRYWQLLLNSLVIAVLTVVLTLVAAAMAGFVFAHAILRVAVRCSTPWVSCSRRQQPSCRCSSGSATSVCRHLLGRSALQAARARHEHPLFDVLPPALMNF